MHEISISKPPLRGIVAVKKMRDFLLPFHSRLMPPSFSSHPAFSDQYLYKCFSLYSLLLSWYPFLLLFLLSFTLIILLWDFHYRPIFPLPFHLPCLFIVLLGMVYVFFFSFRFLIFALFSVSTLVLYSLPILLLHFLFFAFLPFDFSTAAFSFPSSFHAASSFIMYKKNGLTPQPTQEISLQNATNNDDWIKKKGSSHFRP